MASTTRPPRTSLSMPQVRELNIGHFIIGEAVFTGLPQSIALMREAIAKGLALRPFAGQIAQQQ